MEQQNTNIPINQAEPTQTLPTTTNEKTTNENPEGTENISEKKRSNKKLDVWDHYIMLEGCDRCESNAVGQIMHVIQKKNGTSTIRAHLRSCQKNTYRVEDKKQKLLSFSKKSGDEECSNSLVAVSWTKDGARQYLAKYIILDELPFRYVEGEGFKQFACYMNPKFDPPSRITVARDIFQLYLDEKKKLKKFIQSLMHGLQFRISTTCV